MKIFDRAVKDARRRDGTADEKIDPHEWLLPIRRMALRFWLTTDQHRPRRPRGGTKSVVLLRRVGVCVQPGLLRPGKLLSLLLRGCAVQDLGPHASPRVVVPIEVTRWPSVRKAHLVAAGLGHGFVTD